MALPIDFPKSPYTILDPDNRWFPDQKTLEKNFNLIPPLVDKIRRKVKEWRDNDYEGASETTKALLHFWFDEEHFIESSNMPFKYYFAQRESVETIIYLHEIAHVQDKYDLLEYCVKNIEQELTEKINTTQYSNSKEFYTNLVKEK